MAILWADNVNTRILDQTQITIGDGGYVEDKSSSGDFKERRLTSFYVPDTFSVVMDFDWLVKDANGMSEFDRFVTWYKYVHQRGTIPFWFSPITRFNILQPENPVNPITGEETLCQYKITSSLKPQKSGFSYRVTMTWEEVYSGPGIIIPESTLAPDKMYVENGHIQFFFNHTPAPGTVNASDFTVSKKLVSDNTFIPITISSMKTDGDVVHIYFNKITEEGTYFIKVVYNGIALNDGLEVR